MSLQLKAAQRARAEAQKWLASVQAQAGQSGLSPRQAAVMGEMVRNAQRGVENAEAKVTRIEKQRARQLEHDPRTHRITGHPHKAGR